MSTTHVQQRTVAIRNLETNEVVHAIDTTLVGSNYDRFLDGLYRKVDFEKYYIDAPEGQ